MKHPHDEDQAVDELAAEDQVSEELVVEERCWLCLGFGDLANLGPCPACQPDRFAEYLAMLAATTRHHHDQDETTMQETTEEGL